MKKFTAILLIFGIILLQVSITNDHFWLEVSASALACLLTGSWVAVKTHSNSG